LNNPSAVGARSVAFDEARFHSVLSAAALSERVTLGASRRYLVASPEYLKVRGAPASVEEIQRHSAIIYTHRETDWRLRMAKREVVIRPDRCLRLNNGIMIRDAALAGLGIALLPAFLVEHELSKGLLRVVDVGAMTESAEIFVAYPTARASAKLRALVDWLRRAFGTPPHWDILARR
jgi:DNA-binding transcriptional LysR family regulator